MGVLPGGGETGIGGRRGEEKCLFYLSTFSPGDVNVNLTVIPTDSCLVTTPCQDPLQFAKKLLIGIGRSQVGSHYMYSCLLLVCTYSWAPS